MRRLRLDLIGETAFFIAVGVVFGLACRGVSALAGSIRARRSGPPPVPARHRKAGA